MTKNTWGPADVAALRRLIKLRMRQSLAAEALGVAPTNLSRWLLGREPRNYTAVRASLASLGCYRRAPE